MSPTRVSVWRMRKLGQMITTEFEQPGRVRFKQGPFEASGLFFLPWVGNLAVASSLPRQIALSV